MAPWPIITGFGLDGRIYWRLLLQPQSITAAQHQWLHKTGSILTGLRLFFLIVFYYDWPSSELPYGWLLIYECSRSQSVRGQSVRVTLRLAVYRQSVRQHVMLSLRPTVSRPVSLCTKHPCGAQDLIFISVRKLQPCWYGALSLTRGRVCRLPKSQSAVISLLSVRTICILHVIKCMCI
jgi:hypothetical protein